MYKFAVCRYDEYLINHNIGNENDVNNVLAVFDDYMEAYCYYISIVKHYGRASNDFWIAWVKDGQVIQFDRVKLETFTRFRNIKM